MTRPLLLALVLTFTACMKEKKQSEPKTSQLVGHFTRTQIATIVLCDAYFTTKDDPSTMVQFEADAFVTCNGAVMTNTSGFYSASTAYAPGIAVAISLIRSVDGTFLTDTAVVP